MDYQSAYEQFDINAATQQVFGELGHTTNVAYLACDRHCGRDALALRWRCQHGERQDFSFEDLKRRSEQMALALQAQGVKSGDCVAALLPRIPELLVTFLATMRLGAIYQPLFTAFGPKAIEHRVNTSGARVIISDSANRPKLEGLEQGRTLITVVAKDAELPAGDIDFQTMIGAHTGSVELVQRDIDDPFLIMFTSGTTGPAKAVYVPIRGLVSLDVYMRLAVDLRPDDAYWNIADPGWAYGLWFAVTAPLVMGHATTFYDGPFTVDSTLALIKNDGITNLAGAPTAYRLLVAAGPEAVAPIKGQLRAVSSAGEPLNPEVIRWFAEHLSVRINDHYGQTEMGMSLCNHHALDHEILPGAAGFSVPGYRVAVVDNELNELPPGQSGTLAIDLARSPLFWFKGYAGMETKSLGDRYYLSGDTVERNANGSISFVGRDDDVITSAGYRIGPFDVESALVEHPAVVESAVIGKPDPERTEIVKAFVVLQKGYEAGSELESELRQFVKTRLSAHAYPREIEFVEELPKTPSGKIQRFILRNQERAG